MIKRLFSMFIVIVLVCVMIGASPSSASTPIQNEWPNEWTYGSSILVKCKPLPKRLSWALAEGSYYTTADFPEIKQWIEHVRIMERRSEYMQLLIILNRDDMYNDKSFQSIKNTLKDNPNLYDESSVSQNSYMYKGGVKSYDDCSVSYSEIYIDYESSYIPYTKELFESLFGIMPDAVHVVNDFIPSVGNRYAIEATGLSNYFELCYIINYLALFPGCSEAYMLPITAPGPIQPALLGDANNDGLVNIEDILFTRNLIFDDTDTRISEKGYTNILFEEPITVNSILLIRDAIFDTQQ